MPGTLFVVATPIGNLEDLSFRALRTLREVHAIAAEDTRRTSKLLAHYEIRKPLVSLHAHNEHRESARLVARLERGESIALVTDAGTPGISDPGAGFVRSARERGVAVSPIPGPSAVMAALSVSGFQTDRFVFLGFPPRSGTARRDWLQALNAESAVAVVFEAPHRIQQTLEDMGNTLVNRPIQLHRELTKIHEELVVYTNESDVIAPKALGEYVVIVGPKDTKGQTDEDAGRRLVDAVNMVGCMTLNKQFDVEAATSLAAKALDLEEPAVRKAVKKHRISVNRQRQALS